MKTFAFICFAVFIIISGEAYSREFRFSQIPNGNKFQCSNCHVSSNGGGSLNVFGTEVRNNFLTSNSSTGNVIWNSQLASKDSDKDGFTNGQELGDPLGAWKVGNPAPGNFSDVSNPGLASSKPTDVFESVTDKIINDLQIHSIYPNPVINKATLNYELKFPGFVSISLYDYNGNEVKSLFYGFQSSGLQNFTFDAGSSDYDYLSHGYYMIVLKTATNSIALKIIIG